MGIKVIERTSFCLRTEGQTDARLITISAEPCQSGNKNVNSGGRAIFSPGAII